jgi:hypothetical protein
LSSGRVQEFIREFLPQGLSIGGAVSFAAVGLILGSEGEGFREVAFSWAGLIFGAGVLFTVAGNFATVRRRPRITELERENARLRGLRSREITTYRANLRDELARMLREDLGYGDTERISVYRPHSETLQLLARYSKDPELERPPIRSFYPTDQGVLGTAWRDGSAHEPSLPDPYKEEANYYSELWSRWAIPESVSRRMTMRSRTLVGYALEEPRGTDRVAVVVVESVNIGILSEEAVAEALKGPPGQRLCDFLERGSDIEPDPGYARRENY